jgi:serine/threonine protein kinase
MNVKVNILIPDLDPNRFNVRSPEVCRWKLHRDIVKQLSSIIRFMNEKRYPNSYTKFLCKDKRQYTREVGVYNFLKDTNIIPKLLEHGKAFTFTYGDDEQVLDRCPHCENPLANTYRYIVMTHCGQSISSKYDLNSRGPGGMVREEFLIKKDIRSLCDLPPDVPSDIVQKMSDVLYELATKYGIAHLDVHPGNFLIDDSGTVRIIDFEYTGSIRKDLR